MYKPSIYETSTYFPTYLLIYWRPNFLKIGYEDETKY